MTKKKFINMKGRKDIKKGRQGRPAKELIPAGFGKPPRDVMPAQPVPLLDEDLTYDFQLPQQCPLWPGDDAALSHDFSLAPSVQFEDTWEYSFPPSMTKEPIIWQAVEEVCPNNDLSSQSSKRNTGNESEILVVSTYERDETPEEFEVRKQKEIERISHMKGKKPKIEDIVPGKVKEVQLGNLEMGQPLPAFSKWLTSQLQILKDSEWQGSEKIWSMIYPQKNKVPVYNPSGKYWVKLYMQDKAFLVEIDSRMPVLSDGSLLLPRSSVIRDIWPMLLSKAYLKLHSFRWKNIGKYVKTPDEELEGSFFYSITKMIPQRITLNRINSSEWTEFAQHLTDESWDQRLCIVSAHCRLNTKPFIPSMNEGYVSISSPRRNSHEEESKEENTEENARPSSREERTPAQMLREVASQALKAKLNRQVLFKSKTRPCFVIQGFGYLLFDIFENPETFEMASIRRDKAKAKEAARSSLLRAKVKSPARKLQKMNSPKHLQDFYRSKERRKKEREDRKRLLIENKQFAITRLLKIKTSVTNIPVLNIDAPFSQTEIELAKLKIVNHDYFLQKEIQALEKLMDREEIELFYPDGGSIDDFQIEEENPDDWLALQQPKEREKGGVWVSSEDFPSAFQELFVYHSSARYPYNMVLDDAWKDLKQPFMHNDSYDVWVVDDSAPLEILVAFSPTIPSNLQFHPDNTHFSLEDEETSEKINICTTSILSGHLSFNRGGRVLRPTYNCCPCGSVTWVSSTSPILTMSTIQYLNERKGWNLLNLSTNYSVIPKNLLSMVLKADLQVEEPSEIRLKLSSTDANLLEFAELLLIDRSAEPYERSFRSLEIKTLSQVPLALPPVEKGYRLLLQLFPSVSLPEGTVNLDLVSSNDTTKLVMSELLDPAEYSDRYVPNKYGIIFKEHIFLSDEVHFSIHVRMRRGPLATSKTKEVPQKALPPKLITLELFEDSELLASAQGFNQAFIQHINIEKSSPNLQLVCKFDLREWPEGKETNEDTENIFWVIRLISNETTAFVKNTKKEDSEESVKKSWENSQPGRAELAKVARARYLASIKHQKGEVLTEQENELLKDTWEERRKAKKETDPSKAKGKKDDKKEDEEEKEENVVHTIKEINMFLDHLNGERLREQYVERPSYQKPSLDYKSQFEKMMSEVKDLQAECLQSFAGACEQYRTERVGYQTRFEERKESSAKLQAAVNSNELQRIESALSEAETADCDPSLIDTARKTLHNLKVKTVLERIKKAFQEHNVDELKKALELMQTYEVEHEIDIRFINKANIIFEKINMLEAIIANPSSVEYEEFKNIRTNTKHHYEVDALLRQAASKVTSYYTQQYVATIHQAIAEDDKEKVIYLRENRGDFSISSELNQKIKEFLAEGEVQEEVQEEAEQ